MSFEVLDSYSVIPTYYHVIDKYQKENATMGCLMDRGNCH